MQNVADSICDFYTNLYDSDYLFDQKNYQQNRALKLENDALYHLFKNGTKNYEIIENENERITKLIDECIGKFSMLSKRGVTQESAKRLGLNRTALSVDS